MREGLRGVRAFDDHSGKIADRSHCAAVVFFVA